MNSLSGTLAASLERSGRVGQGVFHFADRLPISDPTRAVTLGKGDTPLIELQGKTSAGVALARVRLKCESDKKDGLAQLQDVTKGRRGPRWQAL